MAPHHVFKFLPLDFGAALLGGFFQALFDRILPHNLPRIIVRDNEVVSELNTWEKKLAMIQAVLGDVEEKQWRNMAMKVWLDDLRDFAYDLEDMLDEYATELEPKLTGKSPDDIISITTEELKKLLKKFGTMSDIGVMSVRLEVLCERAKVLDLMERTVGGTSSPAVWQRPPSTCVPTKPAVYGRAEDQNRIETMMSRDEPSGANFRVISIVGMAGVGKTTLAQAVFESGVIDFDLKAWVCVANDFDVFKISMAILESITQRPYYLKNLNDVQVLLKRKVDGKRFLLVLDDVWCNNYDMWEILKSPFVNGARGSRIIVTTQSVDVALTIGEPGDYHYLKLLSDDDCWSVFTKHAFEEVGAHLNLDAIREKVVTKCGGLPLAARTLGGLLRSKERNNNEWRDILDGNIWDLAAESSILSVLKLSYYHLPSHLKKCLAYCAILPKNYEFEDKELVLLWIAEGLILPSTNNKQLEDIGGEYFRDLLSMSIFQKSSVDGSKFVMHNLVNELAQWISGETVFKLEDESGGNIQSTRFQRARHFSYICNAFDGKKKFEVFEKVVSLRTFLPVLVQTPHCFIIDTVLSTLLPKFKKLRVLSLRGYHITELPDDCFKDLRYLRYLNLSHTKIERLPNSISSLCNLQILLLKNCYDLKELPFFMGTLIKLLHLDIGGASLISEMPCGMGNLKELQTLSDFILSKNFNSRCGLKELGKLKFLRGELRISQLQNVTNLQELREHILSDKKNLQVLILEWGFRVNNSINGGSEKEVLDMLRPHTNLTKLTIKHYGGLEFPYWVGDPSFSNMVSLTLEDCKNCKSLPPLGLLTSLKDLTITGMTELTTISSTFYGKGCSSPFPSLETLRLENLEKLVDWEPVEHNEHVKIFYRLRELCIINCPLLSKELPEHLPSLQKLVIRQCVALEVSYPIVPRLCVLETDDSRQRTNTSTAVSQLQNSMYHSNNTEHGNSSGQSIRGVEDLKVKNSPDLNSFLEVFSLSRLTALEIEDCGGPTSLQTVMESTTCLRRLEIKGCNSLLSIVQGQLPSSLKRLEIHDCDSLRFLLSLDDRNNASLLEHLFISGCRSVTTLVSRGQLPVTLKVLEIKDCSALATLSSEGQLPTSLERLEINNCGISSVPIGAQNRGSLREIEISNCINLVSFPQDCPPITSLRKFSVSFCENLVGLPDSMHGFKSLQELQVFACSGNIVFQLPTGLPVSITSLTIKGDALYKSLVKFGLHKLTSLRKLNISGCSQEITFPVTGTMLPASLTYLYLANFSGLKFLNPDFKNLTSLEYFTISGCNNHIRDFPNVLPPSLLKLEILQCCQGLERSLTVGGQRRDNIKIPFIKIDGQLIN